MLLLSQFNWPRILFTRAAAILLGVAAALSVCAVAIMHSDINLDSLSPLKREAISIAGAAGAFGFIALLVCMSFFWLKCDTSSKTWRTIWFVLLLVGFSYGSAIPYYVFVYLPAVRKGFQNQNDEDLASIPQQAESARKRVGSFRRALLVGWGLLLLPVGAALSLPSIMSPLMGPIAVVFFLGSAVVVLEAVVYAIFSLYRSGMSRREGSDRKDTSRRGLDD